MLATFGMVGCIDAPVSDVDLKPDESGVYHVIPTGKWTIQQVLDHVADDRDNKHIIVHAGVYRPSEFGQALIWFQRKHDGIILEAEGDVTLTAENPELGDSSEPHFPAVVNHVVYFGDGVSPRTTLRGFTITGARGLMTTEGEQRVEPDSPTPDLVKNLLFYADGGGIKVFGRSYPTLEELKVVNNTAAMCGGGISIEHRGFNDDWVRIRDCVFQGNRCPGTGAAIDLLSGSSAIIDNCLVVENISNYGYDFIATTYGLHYHDQHGSGALTVFPHSRVEVRNCTFAGNWNGVDDRGEANLYEGCIFWHNDASDGSRSGGPYEIDIVDASRVRNCYLRGGLGDLRKALNPQHNNLEADDPNFDLDFTPRHPSYRGVGYRPISKGHEPDDGPVD
ncbi:MAG: right-handed parallel beta-helix repeat-containing protein [Planctomycetales bacterium]|nr:right-handed parallel beta-helix repeat-containing protein [Planctomycetales bacterium]